MSLPSALVANHSHTITCGVAVLTTDDYFPLGDEPVLEKQTAMDTPDHPGAEDGAIYSRGNTRWNGQWTRVIDFATSALAPGISGWDGMSPEAKAQAYVPFHLLGVPEGNTHLTWNGTGFPKSNIRARGTSDGAFAIFTYSAAMSRLSD